MLRILLAEKILAVAASCQESSEKFVGVRFHINRIFQKKSKSFAFFGAGHAAGNCV